MIDETFLTTEEVLEYLQVNLRTVYRLIKAGKIPAVRAAQADAIAVRDLPRHVVDQGAVAERFREVGKLDHAAGAPSAFDAAASTCGTRNGLVRYPATPRFTASIALDSVEKPVMIMTGRSVL